MSAPRLAFLAPQISQILAAVPLLSTTI
nr:unnamed protein product [Digitaria exilis]